MISEQQMNKMREEFEAWYEGHCAPLESDWFKRDSDFPDDYDYFPAQEAWSGWKASRAALSENHFPDAAKMVVPEGWQLVPVEPTEAMISSVIDAGTFDEDDVAYFWDSMLAAAPKHEGGAS